MSKTSRTIEYNAESVEYDLDEICQMSEGMEETISCAVEEKVAEICERNKWNIENIDYDCSVIVKIDVRNGVKK